MSLSIILPVLNESLSIAKHLDLLRQRVGDQGEIIVVDGGSDDNTVALATPFANAVIVAKQKSRAVQMNEGAAIAQGELLLFLHSDTRLPEKVLSLLPSDPSDQWGFFTVALSGRPWPFRLIETMINLRSRATAVATGDQCLFIRRDCFRQLKGFAAIPLMEDVELCKRLRQQFSPRVITTPVVTSSRRWEKRGIISTVLLMWRLRLAYFLGVAPQRLAKHYH